jgi:hypothetical protein
MILEAAACSPHNNPENHREVEKNGRVAVFCKVCGKFIGYKNPSEKRK